MSQPTASIVAQTPESTLVSGTSGIPDMLLKIQSNTEELLSRLRIDQSDGDASGQNEGQAPVDELETPSDDNSIFKLKEPLDDVMLDESTRTLRRGSLVSKCRRSRSYTVALLFAKEFPREIENGEITKAVRDEEKEMESSKSQQKQKSLDPRILVNGANKILRKINLEITNCERKKGRITRMLEDTSLNSKNGSGNKDNNVG